MASEETPRRKPDFNMSMVDLEAYKENRLELPPEGWEWMNITPEKFKAHQTWMVEREKAVPQVGGVAPDFEIERLSADSRRTGETFRLSSVRGSNVALVFGNYT